MNLIQRKLQRVLTDAAERATLTLNLTQSIGMLLTAFAVPLHLGLNEYGLFAACFSVPASAAVFTHGMFLGLGQAGRRNTIYSAALVSILSLSPLIFSGYLALYGFRESLYAFLIFIILILRSACETQILYAKKQDYFGILIKVESFGVLWGGAVLTVSWIIDYNAALIPLLMLCGPTLAIFFLTIFRQSSPLNYLDIRQLRLSDAHLLCRGVAMRSYEELFITSTPLFISLFAGNHYAGQFRISISLAKILSKLFPYRLEWIMLSISECSFNPLRMFKALGILSSIHILCFLVASLALSYLNVYTMPMEMVIIIVSAPFLVFLLTFIPIAIQREPRILAVVVLLFGLCLHILWVVGFGKFAVFFALSQFILTLFCVLMIFRITGRSRTLKSDLDDEK